MASSKKTGLIILGYVRFALLFVTFIVTIFAFSTRVNENHFINFNASDIISEDIKKFVVETSAFEQANLERGSYTIRDIPSISKKVISFKEAKYAKNFADDLYGAGLASSLEKDVEVKAFTDFNDAKYSQQTNLTQMQMQIGWNNLSDANLVKIAIVDTGVRGNHEDLSGKVLAGYNVLTSSAISANSNSDDHGHGTAMASVAAASANNSVGIVGVSYTSSIIPVKTLNSAGNGLASDVALGVLWAADNSAKIVNLSLGSADYSQVLHDAIQYAVNRGCVVVAASGNDGGSVSYPGRDSLALAVGSVDSADNRSSFSNYGDELDVVAPGESIWHASSSSNSAYAQDTGTSISAAEVSGIMALSSIWYPTLTPAQLIEYICRSAAYVSGMGSGSFSAYYGYGRADYYRMQTVAGTYSAVWAGQSSYPTLADGQSTIMTISYLNTGSVAWVKGVVNLGLVDRNYNFLSTYQLASGWPTSDRPAILNEASVAPGAVGTFTFTVANNNLSEGNYRLDVGLVADGIAWFGHETHAYWDVNVSPRYSAAWVTQSSYPTLADGQSTDLTITYLNTGSATWAKGVVNLGTVYENYQWMVNPYAQGVNWPAGNRPAILNETSVAPGATGSFTFTVGNSGLPAGNYRLDVGLVADGIAWFGHETHAYWDVNVLPSPPRYSASWVGQSSYPVLVDGATATMTITYRNTGSATWTKGVVNLGTVFQDYRWRTDRYALGVNWPTGNRPAVLNESSVTPGQTGTFTFVIENNGLASFNYRLDVGLVADGIAWFGPETHAYWDVNIMPRYSASWVGQSGYPVLNNGDSSTMTITYRNTGSATWTKGVVNLGLIDQNYRFLSSYPMASGWPTSDRPAILNEASVVPGATGSFTFTVANSGLSTNNYRLDVGLVADGIAWFPAATHAYWDVYAR